MKVRILLGSHFIAGSSNGRTAAFGAVYSGSNPGPAAISGTILRMNSSEIQRAFGHKLIGSKAMKKVICRTLLLLPKEAIAYVTKHCWIVSSFEDGWAFTLRGDELKKDECLIFLADELLAAGERQIAWTLLHEVGHVVLGHRNSIGAVQTKSEVRKQEKEADEFVRKFLG